MAELELVSTTRFTEVQLAQAVNTRLTPPQAGSTSTSGESGTSIGNGDAVCITYVQSSTALTTEGRHPHEHPETRKTKS